MSNMQANSNQEWSDSSFYKQDTNPTKIFRLLFFFHLLNIPVKVLIQADFLSIDLL